MHLDSIGFGLIASVPCCHALKEKKSTSMTSPLAACTMGRGYVGFTGQSIFVFALYYEGVLIFV